MEQKKIKKYNHYVPKFYLAYFSGNNRFIDKCILETSQIIRNSPTKSTGGQDFLYGKDSKLEDGFMVLEGEWVKIINNIIKTETIPPYNSEDYANLLMFMCISDARTLATAEDALESHAQMFKVVARLLRDHGRIDASDELIENIGAEAEIPNSYALDHVHDVFEICLDLKIDLIKNISDMPFITSDCPLAKYNQIFIERNYYRHYGYGHMGFQAFLPIHPNYCLVLYDPIPYNIHRYSGNKYILNNANEVRELNKLLVNNGSKELYFSPDTSERTIRKLLKCLVKDAQAPTNEVWGGGDQYLLFHSERSCWLHLMISCFSTKKSFREMPLPPHMGGPIRPYVEKLEEKRKQKNASI